MNHLARIAYLAALAALASFLGACAGSPGEKGADGRVPALRLLNDRVPFWLPATRDKLNEMLQTLGASSASYVPSSRPVAVFDWDNTVVKNDIGDATMFWMIAHGKVRQPVGKDWATTSANLTADARSALNAACDDAGNPGQPLTTDTDLNCADELLSVYSNEATTGGLAAWSPGATLSMNPSYAWTAQLEQGYTPVEVRTMARAAFDQNTWAEIGATQTVGTQSVTGYVRVYEQIRDLIGALQDNGFDVWVVSASPQFVVEAISEQAGVPPTHVIGIRSVVTDGVLTGNLQGCGEVADGANTLITFDQGKRCWINKVIFGQPVGSQLPSNPNRSLRQVFAAGDSDTDIAMLKDATYMKLAINRNKTQIMCNAYANFGGSWRVQPMFLSPKGQKESGYACSTALDASGSPITDEAGKPISDQVDSVFALPPP